MMYKELVEIINADITSRYISNERKVVLQPLIDFIRLKILRNESVNINFICTHNSRRSHISQVWAQVAASYFNIPHVYCYSGGTEETALFHKVVDTFQHQGFDVFKLMEGSNPIYAIKYGEDILPCIGFSKKYDHLFNPVSHFVAVMTCSDADVGCPFVPGAEARVSVTYEDPKVSDGTAEQDQVYQERSLQIASEMFYVFSNIID